MRSAAGWSNSGRYSKVIRNDTDYSRVIKFSIIIWMVYYIFIPNYDQYGSLRSQCMTDHSNSQHHLKNQSNYSHGAVSLKKPLKLLKIVIYIFVNFRMFFVVFILGYECDALSCTDFSDHTF